MMDKSLEGQSASDDRQIIDLERLLLIPTSSLGLLRNDLIESMGIESARRFLMRYGWDQGEKDAKYLQYSDGANLEDKIKYGPILHARKGHVQAQITSLSIKEKDNIKEIYMEGKWKYSYEVLEHIKRFGLSDQPICFTLIGYASGYISTLVGDKVIFKEFHCEGTGHEYCIWVGKSINLWNKDEIKNELECFEKMDISYELNTSYRKLLEERDYLKKKTYIQNQLTQDLLVNRDLQALSTKIFYEIHRVNIIIDRNYLPLAYAGIEQEDVTIYIENMRREMKKNAYINGSRRMETIVIEQAKILKNPLILNQEIYGYCLFIYDVKEKDACEDDYDLIEQVSLMSSLYLLIEKEKLESEHRIEKDFLEEIIDGKYEEKEILQRGSMLGFDLTKSYRLITISYKVSYNQSKTKSSLNDDIIEAIRNYFLKVKKKMLIGNEGDKVLILYNDEVKQIEKVVRIINELLIYLDKKFVEISFIVGVSNLSNKIINVAERYKESLIALRMVRNPDKIVFFEEIGVIGSLLHSESKSEIISLSENLLKPLLNDLELLKTLYVYLLNGGNLENTAKEIALSLSGLRYRLRKIEDLLGNNLKDDPFYNYQLMLAIQSLILLDKITL